MPFLIERLRNLLYLRAFLFTFVCLIDKTLGQLAWAVGSSRTLKLESRGKNVGVVKTNFELISILYRDTKTVKKPVGDISTLSFLHMLTYLIRRYLNMDTCTWTHEMHMIFLHQFL